MLYLGSFEAYTEHATNSTTATFERESPHIADSASRVSIVHTCTQGTESLNVPAQLTRSQISNHPQFCEC
jgi:hypothetical protein